MSAEPITVMPVRQPRYDNTFTDWQRWYRTNEPALVEYYNALTPHVERPDEHDFVEFAMCQWDRVVGRVSAA